MSLIIAMSVFFWILVNRKVLTHLLNVSINI